MRYSNAGRSFEYTQKSSDYAQITTRAAQIQAIEDRIRQDLRAAIQAQINGKLSLRRYYFSIVGPINLTLTGEQNGTVSARFGGFSIRSSATLRKNAFAKAKVSISSTPIWLHGSYDLRSGTVYNLYVDSSFRVDVDVDVDTILDAIPLFNAFVTNKLEDDLESEAEQAIYAKINAQQGYEDTVLGLDNAIPSGTYIYDGRDLGEEIKDGLIDIVSGESISLTLEETPVYYTGLNGLKKFMVDTVTLNISDHLEFEFSEIPHFRWEYDCPINRPCQEPSH